MAIRSTLGEREYDKFVESPSRPDKTAIETVSPDMLLVLQNIEALLASGGGGSPMIIAVTTSLDLTITNEDFVLVVGSNPITISLPNAATFGKKLVIKNVSTEDVTVIQPSGLVNSVASLEIRARRNPTYSAANLGNSITLIPEGGQFWLV